jgi:hypothetical protein
MPTYIPGDKCPNCGNSNYVSSVAASAMQTNNLKPGLLTTSSGASASSFFHCWNCLTNFIAYPTVPPNYP